MKILWVTNSVYPYRQSVFQCVSSVHQLDLITLGAEKSIGGRVHSNWLNKYLYRFRIPFQALFNLRDYDFLVIGGWDSIGYILLAITSKIFRIPHSMLFESTLNSRKYKYGIISVLRSLIFRMVSTVVVLSELSYEAAVAYGGDEKKIIKSKNWFDPANFYFREEAELSSGYRYIYVGRLIPQKGIERMIKAFYEIANIEDSLYIIGDGPERNRVQELCLDERIIFTGLIEYECLSYYLNRANALVFPSLNDVYGFPCLEALSCGLGVVVSKKAGIWKDIHALPGVIVFEEDLSTALTQIRVKKATRQYVDLDDFHFTRVLEIINIAYEKSRSTFPSKPPM